MTNAEEEWMNRTLHWWYRIINHCQDIWCWQYWCFAFYELRIYWGWRRWLHHIWRCSQQWPGEIKCCLFFVELALTLLYVLSANTDYQSQIIAHGICKNFSTWQFMENMTRGAKSGGTREPGSQKVYWPAESFWIPDEKTLL